MESKISPVVQNSSFFLDTSKTTNLGKQKDFSSTLKSHGQNNKDKNDFQSKSEDSVKGKGHKTEAHEKDIKNKDQEKDFKNHIKSNEEKDTTENYADKYNMFFNVFNSMDELESKENLILEENPIEVVNLESLSKVDAGSVKEFSFKDEEILETLANLSESESKVKEILVDEEPLEKDIVKGLNIDKEKLSIKVNQEGETKKDIDIVSIKPFKENENLISKDNEEEVVEYEKNQLQGPEKSSKEETSEDLSKENKSETFKLEEVNKGSEEKVEEKSNLENKSSFTLEKQEVKIAGMDNLEVKDQEPVDKKQFMEHIIEKVKYDLSSNKNQIRMTLKPESLGEMIMEVEVVKNSLVAKIMVDNQRSKELIENNLFQLKEGVKDTGLEIKTFEVFVGNNSDFDKHNFNGFNFNRRNEKPKVKVKVKENEIGFYEDSIQSSRINPLDIYSESSLNLLA